MAREVLGGLVAPFDLLPPTAEHLGFVGKEDLLGRGDAIKDPGDADLLRIATILTVLLMSMIPSLFRTAARISRLSEDVFWPAWGTDTVNRAPFLPLHGV